MILSSPPALVVIRPADGSENGCLNGPLTISSSLLNDSTDSNPSELDLPPTLFNDTIREDEFSCSEVGIVSVVYDGASPLFSHDEGELLPNEQCTTSEARQAHGEWSVGARSVRVILIVLPAFFLPSLSFLFLFPSLTPQLMVQL